MSSSSGRKRPQKHQNTTAWKADKFKSDPKTKLVQSLIVVNCCQHCTGVIEWKIKYGKYKPLSQPGRCVKCNEKRVKFAYHVLCEACVETTGHCAKCNKPIEVVNKPQTSVSEASRLAEEYKQELKALPERKRRTLLRALKSEEKAADEGDSEVSLTQIRSGALEKLKVLKEELSLEDEFDDLDFGDESSEDE